MLAIARHLPAPIARLPLMVAFSQRLQPEAAAEALRRVQFEQLFARFHPQLLDFLYGMTRDRDWAADLAQETFLRAYAAKGDVTAIATPQAWLYRIATNAAINATRRHRRFDWLPLSRIEADADDTRSKRWPASPLTLLPYEDVAATVAERDAVWSVLAELPPRWRAVLLLQTVVGFEVGEIAALLRLSEANVRKLLFRAKERFRQIHTRHEARGGDR
jgi:RNA polymerase sigma-70 factor (ECF subfamily)